MQSNRQREKKDSSICFRLQQKIHVQRRMIRWKHVLSIYLWKWNERIHLKFAWVRMKRWTCKDGTFSHQPNMLVSIVNTTKKKEAFDIRSETFSFSVPSLLTFNHSLEEFWEVQKISTSFENMFSSVIRALSSCYKISVMTNKQQKKIASKGINFEQNNNPDKRWRERSNKWSFLLLLKVVSAAVNKWVYTFLWYLYFFIKNSEL